MKLSTLYQIVAERNARWSREMREEGYYEIATEFQYVSRHYYKCAREYYHYEMLA